MQETVERIDDAPEQLAALVRSLLDTPRHDVGWRVWIAFWHEAAINSELASVASDRTELSESLIERVIEGGVREGSLRCDNPAAAAAELAALVDGVAIRLYGETGRWSREQAFEVLDRAIRMLQVNR
jgi:AcrR family transcriptional regulator